MSWIDDEIKENEDRRIAEQLKNMKQKTKKETMHSLYRTEILPFKTLVEKAVKEANDELERAGKSIRAIVEENHYPDNSDYSSSLKIKADGYEYPYFTFDISKTDSFFFDSRYCVELRLYEPGSHWIDECTTLCHARFKRINKSNIIAMMGIISGRIKQPIYMKKIFPNLKPIPITTCLIAGGILLFILMSLFSKK